MLSSVYIAGNLGENKGEGIRIVEVDACLPSTDGKFEVMKIPVFSKLARKSFFFTAAEGSLIVLKGRLETHPEYGLIVIDEIDEIYVNRGNVVKTVTRSD